MSILRTILENKLLEVEEARGRIPLAALKERLNNAPLHRPFAAALRRTEISVIAEIKKASPSRGILVRDFDHRKLADEFKRGGASALSVLTDKKYFQGDPAFLIEIRDTVDLPLLRKDFIIDEYQVYESKLLGADAILLIVKALSRDQLERLHEAALSINLEVLVETHTREEIAEANRIGAGMIGINNRDLESFEVSLNRSLELRHYIRPEALAVSESGIQTAEDRVKLKNAGFQAILVGEGLVMRGNPAEALQDLVRK
jgi:indole-3-glycerol phosphate synthase